MATTPIVKRVLPNDGSSTWAGMGNFEIFTPDEKNNLEIIYAGEPPHGDSYHVASLNGEKLPGYVWGCQFASDIHSHYFVCSWMLKILERKTIVINCEERKFFVLPDYIYDFEVDWPKIIGVGHTAKDKFYEFSGNEVWLPI